MPPLTPDELERLLKALANVNRIRLLQTLQRPKGYRELDLQPSREDSWGSDERAITRQAVRGHLKALMDIGVVREARDGDGASFVVNHARLFGVVEELRQLATLRPTAEAGDATMNLDARTPGVDVAGPHLALVRGVEEGRAFPLLSDRAEWTIGRRRSAEICLDYDPYVSSDHARIVRRDGAFFLMDAPASKNGTLLNWSRVARGALAPLKAGDVVSVGRSLLVFRG